MRCPFCGAEQQEPAAACAGCGADLLPLRPGERVAGRYEVRAHLGRGGMGSVYRAFDTAAGREVALKVLRPSGGEPDAERRFRRELELARRVDHPNVCRVHDGGQEGARRFLVMELVDGETLAARLARGVPPAELALRLALQAAEGLAAVHRAGIVHRDVKSLNLMVEHGEHVRLLDFGIARPTAPAATATTTGALLGSPEYLSPEQARGRAADARSDVYSLGIVLYELFTGAVPFRADTPVATLLQHLERRPQLERVPADVRPVVERALAKDPAQRYADGAALAAALQERRSPAPRRSRAVPLSAAVAVALLLAAAGWWLRTRPLPGAAPPPTAAAATALVARPGPALPAQSPPAALSSTAEPRAAALARAAARRLDAPPTPASTRPPGAAPQDDRPAQAGIPEQAAEPAPPGTLPREAVQAEPSSAEPSSVVPAPAPAREPEGALLVLVQPWADISVDGVARGQTPLGRIVLPPGPHAVLLTHPDYQPYPRRVSIRAGETLRLNVDLRSDGVPRR